MSTTEPEPTEEELRAAYEAELSRIRVEHILLEQVVTLVNLGMRRTGLAPGTENERDPGQVQLAIEAIRALVPLLETTAPEQVGPIRQALSQLQLAYVRIGGAPADAGAPSSDQPPSPTPPSAGAPPPPPAEAPADPAKPGDPGPAQRSGRLWVPGMDR
ncbi:MAG TPA: hypothetical protein VG223_12820 [Solirubrobacteraceae bacterium]|nr:hypothetical protein [Solirubrobacteraceae bacterium]